MKKAVLKKALPFIIGLAISLIFLLFIVAFISEMLAIIASDAGANNKKHEEEVAREEANLSSLERYTITGRKEGNKYILTFSFSGWKIEEIGVLDSPETQSIKVNIPALSGTREEIAYAFLLRKGFTPAGACGLMANMAAEGGPSFSATQEEDNAPYRGETVIGKGFGICQWTNSDGDPYGRRYKLLSAMANAGFTQYDNSTEAFLFQLNYAITEPGYENIVNRVKYQTSASEAAAIWCREWERPANVDLAAANRGISATNYYNKFKDRDVNTNDSGATEEVTLKIKLEEEDGTTYFDGYLSGTAIGGSFDSQRGEITGKGTYGEGAYSRAGNFVSPYGSTKFYITSLALAYRPHPVTGEPDTMHYGWDLSIGGDGTPIYSVMDGEVVAIGFVDGGGPHSVAIKCGDLYVWYLHMSAHHVSVGDKVRAGDRIGDQGNLGISTGSHLHLEFKRGSLWGESTANLDMIQAIFMEYALNYNSIKGEFSSIVR